MLKGAAKSHLHRLLTVNIFMSVIQLQHVINEKIKQITHISANNENNKLK